jgi:hypothetical protein
MLRALSVLAVVSSCAPIAPTAPSARTPESTETVRDDRLAPSTAGDSGDGSERNALRRSHAARLAPPFGSSAGVRRVAGESDGVPENAREIVAAAEQRD